MTCRKVLVHQDGSRASRERLQSALNVARWFDARIEAIYAVTPWLWLYPPESDAMKPESHLSAVDIDRKAEAKAAVADLLAASPGLQWSEPDLQSPYDMADHALYADLLVLGRRDMAAPDKHHLPADFVPSIIAHSGRPALVLPHGCLMKTQPQTLLVGWNASPQAARALTASLPWLRGASKIHVAAWPQNAADRPLDARNTGSRVRDYLLCHGIDPIVHVGEQGTADVGEALLQKAESLRADMLIMGCYGHTRTKEWLLGGATRTVLQTARLPLLMAH